MTRTCCEVCCSHSSRLFNHVLIVLLTFSVIGMITLASIQSLQKFSGPVEAGPLWHNDGSSHISGLVILAVFGGVIGKLVFYTAYNTYHDNRLWTKSETNMRRYQTQFIHGLGGAKVGVICILLIVSVVYQGLYGNIPAATTFFGSDETMMRAITDMCLTGVMGFVTSYWMMLSRGFPGWQCMKTSLIVGFILGLFNVSLESSGFNRYLAEDEIILVDDNCPYTALNGVKLLNETELKRFIIYSEGGPPFLISLAYTSEFLIMMLVFTMTWSMIKASIYGGFSEPDFAVMNIPKICCSQERLFI